MKNTIENNKLIAEFIGLREENGDLILPLGNDEWYIDLSDEDTFKFDYDWNWLMPVVEKIESLNLGDKTIKTVFSEEDFYINSNVSFLIMHKECYINFFGEMKAYTNWISVTECNSKIEAVYTAVVEFIKWHNLNK